MKRFLIIVAAIVTAFTLSGAQAAVPQERSGVRHQIKQSGKRVQQRSIKRQRLGKILNLSALQKSRIAEIRRQAKTRIQAIRDRPLAAAQRREAVRKVRMEARQEILAVLTPQQKAKLHGMRKRVRDTLPKAAKTRRGKPVPPPTKV